MNLINLIVCHFKHGGDLGELGRLWEAGELICGHCQISAWSLEDIVAVDAEKLFVKVAVEWERSSLRIEPIVPSSLSPCDGCLVFSPLRAVDVPVLPSNALLLGLAVPGRAVNADVEDRTTSERWEKELLGECFGEGLCRALRLGAWIFL